MRRTLKTWLMRNLGCLAMLTLVSLGMTASVLAETGLSASSLPDVSNLPLGDTMFQKEFAAGGYLAKTVIEPVRGERRGVSTLRYRVSPKTDFNAVQGSIVVQLKREVVPDGFSTPEFDTLFSLLDRQGQQVMTAYVTYGAKGSYVGEYGAGITIHSNTEGKDSWGLWIPFNQQVEVGEICEIRFVWGHEGNWIFLNGQLLQDVYMDFKGQNPRNGGGKIFAQMLQHVSLLQVGADPFNRDNSPLDSSRLLSLTIYSR